MTYHRKAEICPPAISLKAVAYLLFDYQGSVYSIRNCPSAIFKSAVREQHPGQFKDTATDQLLDQDELQLVDRWYLLNELIALGKPLHLYP